MKYYCVKQHDSTDFGAACLATIAKQNGCKVSIAKIREAAGTDLQGTNVYGLIRAAEMLGFSAKGVKGEKEAIFQKFPLLCIAHVVIDGSMLHYVVIHKVTQREVIIADPAVGIVKLKPEEFFGEVEEGKTAKYYWSGILVLIVKNSSIKTNESDSVFGRFFQLLMPHRKLLFNIFLLRYCTQFWEF